MSKGLLIVALSVVVVGLVGPVAANELPGYGTHQPYDPPDRPEDLFQGDLGAEMGLGCSNGYGTSGGPNDVAVGVTAGLTPPFCITQHYYYIFTNIAPYITALSFVCWSGGGSPGAEFARQAGLPWAQSPPAHTVAISPPIMVNSAQFYFGQNQPQTNVGMRWGLDTSSSAATSYILAPACGAFAFTLVDALGFPGNWCFSVTVDAASPVELSTWGAVKAAYK